ncbi:MAG: TldD/PmbA family protein [Bdellovibrio sp.]
MDTVKQNFDKVVQQARQDGARVELLISGGEDLSISFQKKKLESFESTQSQMAGFRVILGSSQGYAYTEKLSEDSFLRTYREALNNAKTVEAKGQQEIPLVKGATALNADAWKDLYKIEDVSMAQKLEVARLLEEACLSKDTRIQSVPHSSFSESVSFKRILNSEGLDQSFKHKYYTGYAYPLAKEGESSKMDGEGFFVRSFNQINTDEVTTDGVRYALSRLNAQKLPTGNYPVVIDRRQFPMILQMIYQYFSAKEVHEGKSLFKGKLGQKTASEKLNLEDNPFEMRGAAFRPFDDEGAASQKTVLIENGVLKNYLTNLHYAKMMDLPHTANAARSPASQQSIAPTNLVVSAGTKTLKELLSSHSKVVHLTEFSGGLHAGFKDSTGDFSMPAEGFLYENGKCIGPIDQFVMSGNVLDLLRDIEEIGNEYNKPGSSMICPDVLIKSLSFAGA